MADYIYMMESRLSPAQLQVVGQVQDIARAHEMNVYLTGGAVRDIISGFPIRDLDFTVQGNIQKLQKDLQKIGAIIQGSDEGFRILYVLFQNHVRAEIASARSESYPKPGKPEVTFETGLQRVFEGVRLAATRRGARVAPALPCGSRLNKCPSAYSE